MVAAPEVAVNGTLADIPNGSSSNSNGNGHREPLRSDSLLSVNGGSSPSAGLGIETSGSPNESHSRLESRRASFQSKELSEMDFPEPSWLSEARGQRQLTVNPAASPSTAPQTADGLLTTSDNLTNGSGSSGVVASVPSSPYTGTGAWSPNLNSAPRFGDTAKYEELVARLEALNLPEPEILTSGSKRDEEEKERILKELQDVIAEMELPEPEYIQKFVLRSQGAKTPEPQAQQPGEAMSPKVARATSIKRANGRGGDSH